MWVWKMYGGKNAYANLKKAVWCSCQEFLYNCVYEPTMWVWKQEDIDRYIETNAMFTT